MPITITIEAATVSEARQLVADLANVMPGVSDEQFPTDTKFSTLEVPAEQVYESTVTTAQTAPAVTPAATISAPTAPVTPPTAAPATAPTAPAAPAAPTAAPTYDFNQLASATMQLQQAGQNIFELFQQFGIQSLNMLPKERYTEYAAVLRQRGAKI